MFWFYSLKVYNYIIIQLCSTDTWLYVLVIIVEISCGTNVISVEAHLKAIPEMTAPGINRLRHVFSCPKFILLNQHDQCYFGYKDPRIKTTLWGQSPVVLIQDHHCTLYTYLCSFSTFSTLLLDTFQMNRDPSPEPAITYSASGLNTARLQSHPTWKPSALENKIARAKEETFI